MSVSITVSLSQKSQNAASLTSVVHVEVVAYYTAGSYNHYTDADRGAVLHLTIDGYEYSFVAPFGSKDSSGQDTLYSADMAVSHNSDGTKTLFASAVFATGVSAGTVSGSDSLTLTRINVSGGGSDSGDEESGSGSGTGTGTAGSAEGVVISNGSKFESYKCYIDTYHATTKEFRYECETSGTAKSVTFMTPSYQVDYDAVTVSVSDVYAFLGDDSFVNYSVFLRDANNELIAQKSVSYTSQGSKGTVNFVLNPSTPLKANTEYRVSTSTYQSGEAGAEVSGTISGISVTGDLTGMVNEFLEYTPYIDNGTTWEPI